MAIIYTYPVKTTPVDADLVLISDSADSNNTKQVTISSIKGLTAGVTSIIAGNNVNITSTGASGTGDVTIGGTPTLPLNSVQFNNNSSFGGNSGFTFTNAGGVPKLTIGNTGSDVGGIIEIQSDENGGVLKIGGGSQSYYTSIKGSDSDTASYDIILPTAGPGGNNKILESTSSGVLSWITTPAAGTVTSYTNGTDNRILTSSGADSINGESSLVYDGSTLTLGTSKVFNASRSTVIAGVATAPIYVTNSTLSSGAPTNFASNIAGGNGSKHIEFYHGGTSVGFITSNSTNIVINGEASDERKKKNIVDWTENVLDKFALIEPKKFNFTHQDDSDPLIKGFIAQQMVDKFPEAYNHDYSISDTEGYYSFNAMGMNVYLMKAIKELKEEIDNLKSRISTLEG